MAEIWDDDELGPMPEQCGPCRAGKCPHATEFFNVALHGVLYGPFACGCLCDQVSVEAAMDPERAS